MKLPLLMALVSLICASCASVNTSQSSYPASLVGTWGTEGSDECIEPEVLEYSSAKSRIYIRFPGDGGTTNDVTARNLFEYVVLTSSADLVRVALIGEDRLSAAGQPVTWDMVKVDDDRYCWRRSDWEVTQCTVPRVRCPS